MSAGKLHAADVLLRRNSDVFALRDVPAMPGHRPTECLAYLSMTSVGTTEPWIDMSITAGPALQTSGPL